jgi:23S rRNA pseudouridine2605 synthase
MEAPEPGAVEQQMRLNRFLARCGIASRRRSDELIQNGVISINGEIVDEPGRVVDVNTDRVEYQGLPVILPDQYEYLLLNKPAGYLVTRSDPGKRPTVYDLLQGLHPGTVPVGRLDMDTTGLLLLTDDGELGYRLLHPRFVVDKRYVAVVSGDPTEDKIDRLRRGIDLGDGPTAPAEVKIEDRWNDGYKKRARLSLCIHEGRKRQIRRMLFAIGHPVRELARVEFAGLHGDGLAEGQYRSLKTEEVKDLKARVGL